jgi:riboflavin synthase
VFGGLIAYRGRIARLEAHAGGGTTLAVRCDGVERERPERKDSIAIDGACLTATEIRGEEIVFDVVPETVARTTLGERAAGDVVNVEYALRLGERIGGHLVYGHVDAAICVIERAPDGQGERMRFEMPSSLAPLIAEKGYVALDGVSLTVTARDGAWFEVALIPETLARTTLGARRAGMRVNLEVDPLARYAAQAVRA